MFHPLKNVDSGRVDSGVVIICCQMSPPKIRAPFGGLVFEHSLLMVFQPATVPPYCTLMNLILHCSLQRKQKQRYRAIDTDIGIDIGYASLQWCSIWSYCLASNPI